MSSMSYPEFLEDIKKRRGKDPADKIELAIDGILYRESLFVIARYTGFSIKNLLAIKRNIRTDNDKDYFSM